MIGSIVAAAGQSLLAQSGTALSGIVVDEHGAALPGATVDVRGSFWSAQAERDGHFSLTLPPGDWIVRARRLGYRPRELPVHVVARQAPPAVVLQLTAAPELMQGVTVAGERRTPLSTTVVADNVRHVPPLGEPDIFRLLPFIPGILQPNDLIGRVHLAGGASDEHRVFLDGFPLQAPFHVLSVLGAFNVAALDRADVFMHHLEPEYDGGLSGAISLESRDASTRLSREATASLLSASATTVQPSAVRGTDILASGRVTYLDKLLRGYGKAVGTSDDVASPGFRDLLLKATRRWSSGWSAAILGFATKDYWQARNGGPAGSAPRWGEHLAGVTTAYRNENAWLRTKASVNRSFVAYSDSIDDPYSSARLPDVVNVIQRWEAASMDAGLSGRWWSVSGFLGADRRSHAFDWSGTKAGDWFTSNTPDTATYRSRQLLRRAAVEGKLTFDTTWALTATAQGVAGGGGTYFAPAASLSRILGDAFSVEIAASRRFQFDAIAAEPLEGTTSQPVYLLAQPRQADMAALSIAWRPDRTRERRVARAEATAFARNYRHRTNMVPDSGSLPFPTFARGDGSAIGATFHADVPLPGNGLVEASYTFQRVRETVDGSTRPTTWDAPHMVSAFAAIPLGRGWGLTSALQWRSGTAVTPVQYRILTPLAPNIFVPRYLLGAPNSARLPAYKRLDLGARKTWSADRREWTLTLQVLNVVNRTNQLEYEWGSFFFCRATGQCGGDSRVERRGLPILPSLGLEVRW